MTSLQEINKQTVEYTAYCHGAQKIKVLTRGEIDAAYESKGEFDFGESFV